MTDLEKTEVELAALMEHLKYLQRLLAQLDDELEPYWPQKRAIDDAIAETHEAIEHKDRFGEIRTLVVAYVGEGSAERRQLFAQKDALQREYGRLLEHNRKLKSERKDIERAIRHLTPKKAGARGAQRG